MDQNTDYQITVASQIHQIGQADWDACANPDGGDVPIDPFTTYRFLAALEDSKSVGKGTGWYAQHLIAKQGDQIIAVMPCYAKTHSQGEYIFDHNFAHAYQQSGGEYYPKLQASVPFTPVTGRRYLTRPDMEHIGQELMISGGQSLARQQGWSSFHTSFCDLKEYQNAGSMMQRISQQYHWYNQDYADFDAFLADLSSRKRKNIRKERARAQGFGGRIEILHGDDIKAHHWDAIWTFYQDTGARKWGRPYLTRAFFEAMDQTMREDIVLFMAHDGARYVAGAMNFLGRDAIYGRYWGCAQYHDAMHFELCYYCAIDYAIKHGLKRVEAGAQGEHKLARGYLPAPVYSLHWFANADFGDAVARYLDAERDAIGEEIEVLTTYGPFKSGVGEDD